MKKLMAIFLAVAMMLCMTACVTNTTENPDTNKEPAQDSYSFTYKGTKISLHAPAADIIAALGEPKSYSQSTSCAFEGLDKTYEYDSIFLQTYPIGDKDYVYSWWFKDDLASNDEGICIGTSLADVKAAYGESAYNGTNAFQITKGSGMLTIILENDMVTSIQYVIVAE